MPWWDSWVKCCAGISHITLTHMDIESCCEEDDEWHGEMPPGSKDGLLEYSSNIYSSLPREQEIFYNIQIDCVCLNHCGVNFLPNLNKNWKDFFM